MSGLVPNPPLGGAPSLLHTSLLPTSLFVSPLSAGLTSPAQAVSMLQQQQLAQTVALQQQMPFGLMPGVPGDGSEKSCTVLPIHPHFPAVINAAEPAGLATEL